VEWIDDVAPCPSSWNANITHDNDQSSSGHQHPERMPPHLVQLIEKVGIVDKMPQLAVALWVLLESPIRW